MSRTIPCFQHRRAPAALGTRLALLLLALPLLSLPAATGVGQDAPSALVAFNALRVQGPLPRAAVQEIMERTLDTYRRCLSGRLSERGRLAGELRVRVHVEANGEPIAASVDWSNVGDRLLERCVAQATEAWRLPERDAATVVSFSLRVGQGAPTGAEHDVGAVIASGDRDDAHLPAGARNTQTGAGRERARPVRRSWAPVDNGLRVTGALSDTRVAQVLRTKTPTLRRCVSVPSVGSAAPAPWDVLVSLRLGGDGRVSEEPVVQVPGAPPSVIACVAAVLREARFPASAGDSQVVARYRAAPQT